MYSARNRMYYVLNALENGFTTPERSFAIFAEFVRDIILGLVAGLITTIQMNSSGADTETEMQLTKLRTWLREKKLPAAFRKKMSEHFTQVWSHRQFDITMLANDCPPAMAANLTGTNHSGCTRS